MKGCKPCATPMESNYQLKENGSDRLIDAGRYQRFMRYLIYLSLTKPKITYTINVISQFMYAPTQDHMEVAYRVLKNLRGFSRKGIFYKRHGHHTVKVYTNADWARSLSDHKSTSSIFFFFWCGWGGSIYMV